MVYIKINLIWTKSALVAGNFCDTNMVVTAEFQKESTHALIASLVILFCHFNCKSYMVNEIMNGERLGLQKYM